MYKAGDVVLANVQFTDTFEVKKRPAVVLFSEFGNITVAGITSNTDMKGVPLTKAEGAVKDSVIKANYIFTVHERAIEKKLFALGAEKRKSLYEELESRLRGLLA